MNHDALGLRVGRLDPEFAKEWEFLIDLGARADGQSARREAIALAATEKSVITRAEERDHLVHDMRRVQRVMQTEAREAEIDRQRRWDFVMAVIE